MSENNPIFEAKNLSLDYIVGNQAIKAIYPCDIVIPRGSITVIFGASGSGKSSMLNIISGLQKPTGGVITFNDKDIYKQTKNNLAYYRAHDLGIVYQTNYWVKSLNVLDNVAMPLFFQGEAKDVAHQRAKEALEQVSMGKFANKYPVLLSGGEQQRIAMARAIINNPAVIIADEPTGSLDSTNGDLIIGLLQKLQKDYGKTIILVTHNMEYLHVAKHLLEIQDGKVTQIEEKMISPTVKSMLTNAQDRLMSMMKKHEEA